MENIKMSYEIKFADALKELITKKGITQTALAESLYCNGKSYPELNNLLKIASYFGVSTDYLITGERPEYMDIREELHLSDKAIENLKNQKDSIARNALLSDEKFYKEFSGAINIFLSYKFLSESEIVNIKEKLFFINPLGNKKLELSTISVLEPSRIMNDYFINFFNEFGKYFPDNKINNQE